MLDIKLYWRLMLIIVKGFVLASIFWWVGVGCVAFIQLDDSVWDLTLWSDGVRAVYVFLHVSFTIILVLFNLDEIIYD